MSVGKKPRKPLPRYKGLKSTPLRPKKRSAAEREEKLDREYGGESRLAWIAAHCCLACGSTPSENAHTANGGMSRKADAETIVPLCSSHHRELHRIGVKTFEGRHSYMLRDLTLSQWATWMETAWQRTQSELTPLSAIIPSVVADLMGDA